ncbi:MAG: HPr(Ser) kinase/phosphatase [Defluviitaleaceae bacterium]|nr:HPr(Ser) kinase/phosphatase [Defluviitaleaceae bacterium]
MNTVTIQDLANALNLEIATPDAELNRTIEETFLNRPGMELMGFDDYFQKEIKARVQLIGTKEWNFLASLSTTELKKRVSLLFNAATPALIFANNYEVPHVVLELSKETGVPILKSKNRTSSVFATVFNYLQEELAVTESYHGVLVDVNGIGVMITGKSSIGKSETGLGLIRRGHQLVADDRIDIFEKEVGMVIGRAPEILKKFIEIRGIGIINVVEMFGAGAYRDSKRITLVVELEDWSQEKEYNRIGLAEETVRIFETDVAKITIPVKTGRSIASLIEVAAINHRLKLMGYHAAEDFTNQLDQFIAGKSK